MRRQAPVWRNWLECGALGFVAGFLLGVWTGHFVLALVPAIVVAILFAGVGALMTPR